MELGLVHYLPIVTTVLAALFAPVVIDDATDETRRIEVNNATITALAAETAPEILWRGPFKQLINTAVDVVVTYAASAVRDRLAARENPCRGLSAR